MKAVAALALVVLSTGCGGGTRGWHVGSGGAYRWASTIPYRDCPNCVPPHTTLAELPPGGIVIQIATIHKRASRDLGRWPPRIRTRDVAPGFEGLPARIGVWARDFQTGRTEQFLYIWFGRAHPAAGQLARANAELACLSP